MEVPDKVRSHAVKTDQERIDYLANRVREFNIQVSGGGLIDGGFGKLPPIGQGDITIEHLEQAFSEFRLTGNNGIQAHGSLEHGYLLFGNPPAAGPQGFAPVVPLPPVTPTGACCADDGSCSITTEVGCVGTYQGDGTVCDPNPCSQLGACCDNANNCTQTTEADCTGYWEVGTCSPNPCNICSLLFPTSITLSGINMNCSCIEAFTGCDCDWVTSSTTLPCPPPGFIGGECCGPPTVGADGTYVLGAVPPFSDCASLGGLSAGGIHQCITNQILWNDGSCSDVGLFVQPFTDVDICVGCATSFDVLYPGSPLGYYILIENIFWADGIADPFSPVANMSSCGAPQPWLGGLNSYGSGGTATLS